MNMKDKVPAITDNKTAFERFLDDPNNRKEFAREELIIQVTELISDVMEIRGVKRSELAERLDTSRSFVSQVLRGTSNMTLKTLSDVFYALDYRVNVRAVPNDYAFSSSPYRNVHWDVQTMTPTCRESGQHTKRFERTDDPKLLIMLGAA